jgi:hypothetical protein
VSIPEDTGRLTNLRISLSHKRLANGTEVAFPETVRSRFLEVFMRVSLMGAVPVLAALTALPAGAQISARVHVDIPIGRQQQGVIYGAPRRQVIVRDYDEGQFGPWDEYYDNWEPVTLYYYDGYYYDYPVVAYARPIVVFSYRNQFFLPPRVRAYDTWRRTYRPNGRIIYRGSTNYRPYQPAPRGRDDRYDPRRGNDGRSYQPAPRGGNDGRDSRPAPRGPGNGSTYPGRNDGHQGGQIPGGNTRAPARSGSSSQGHGHGDVQGGHGGGNGRSRPRP